jgi:hypothetical protein
LLQQTLPNKRQQNSLSFPSFASHISWTVLFISFYDFFFNFHIFNFFFFSSFSFFVGNAGKYNQSSQWNFFTHTDYYDQFCFSTSSTFSHGHSVSLRKERRANSNVYLNNNKIYISSFLFLNEGNEHLTLFI